jgi:hypothetical protein
MNRLSEVNSEEVGGAIIGYIRMMTNKESSRMTKKRTQAALLFTVFIVLITVGGSRTGYAISSDALIVLKQAGVSDGTIQVLVEEKALETAAFTVPEIVALKEAGLSEETIQLVIREGSFMKDREPIVYGKDLKPLKFTTAKDIIELKNAGVSDEVIKAIIVYSSQDSNDRDRQRAWEMLNNMGLVVDERRRW